MNDMEPTRRRESGAAEEPGVDVRRYASVVRRSWRMIALIVLLVTGTVVLLSLFLPKSYESTATIALNANGSADALDAESAERRLSTVKSLLDSRSIGVRVTEAVPERTPEDINAAVSATVDPEANLVDVTASDEKPVDAARIANATAQAVLDLESELTNERLAVAAAKLRQRLEAVEGAPSRAAEAEALRQRLSDLAVQQASTGSDLQIVKAAEIPTRPASPRPVRNGILALFASLFLGVLIGLARDQFRPGIGGSRELSRLTGWPVLAGVPRVSRRLGRSRAVAQAIEHEAYQTLSAGFQQLVPPGGPRRIVVVTSAGHAEGKTTATARLGQALAQAGHKTLLISADLRWPSLHSAFGLPLEPGFTEVLTLAQRAGVSEYVLPATAHAVDLQGLSGRPAGELHVLTSGGPVLDPASLLASSATVELLQYVRAFDYTYVLLDSPPAVGIADIQPLIQLSDGILFVARLDQVNVEKIVDVQELLTRMGASVIGSVVIGARVDASPYYLERPPVVDPRSAARL